MNLLNRIPGWVVLGGVLTVLPARADRVVLANGHVLEGKVESREANEGAPLRLSLGAGWVEIPRDQVVRVEKAPAPWEVYAEKAKVLEPDDLEGHLALARWCRDRGLLRECRLECAVVLKLDADHAEARSLLGCDRGPASVRPAPAVAEAGDDDGEAEASDRPVERFEAPALTRRPCRTASVSPWRDDGYYPVRAGSIWYFPWGWVAGSPVILSTPLVGAAPCVPSCPPGCP